MPAYGHALSERDGWAIVGYIRALQQHVEPGEVPESQRTPLLKQRAAIVAKDGQSVADNSGTMGDRQTGANR
jgi:hypothetical protein